MLTPHSMVSTTKEAIMPSITRHVSKFVAACEALHWQLIEGCPLTVEDRNTIEQAAIQLLMRAQASTDTPDRLHLASGNRIWKRFDEQLEQDPHP